MRNQWASTLAFAFGLSIVVFSMVLEALGTHTGFWLITGIGFTVIAASLVLDGQVGVSNPRIAQKSADRSRFSELALALIRSSRRR
jgi:hypothetical protein